jgi:hypothetical protein
MIEGQVSVDGAAKDPSRKLVKKWDFKVYKNFLGRVDEQGL